MWKCILYDAVNEGIWGLFIAATGERSFLYWTGRTWSADCFQQMRGLGRAEGVALARRFVAAHPGCNV